MTDHISEAFATITIEDFLRSTSAIKVVDYDQEAMVQYSNGENNWRHWTDMLVESCIDDLPDDFQAFAVLHNDTSQRFFQPDDDETAFDFAKRLNREALDMEASWFFSAMMVPGRTYDEDATPPPIDPDNRDDLIQALDEGILQMGVCWFSRGYCRPMVEEAGMLRYDHTTDSVDHVRGAIEPEHNPFHNVLDG